MPSTTLELVAMPPRRVNDAGGDAATPNGAPSKRVGKRAPLTSVTPNCFHRLVVRSPCTVIGLTLVAVLIFLSILGANMKGLSLAYNAW